LTSNHFFVKQKDLHPPYARLGGEEHHHLSRVLRVRPGEKVWLVDEQGSSFRAEVVEVERWQTRLLLLEKEEPSPAKIRLILAQALIKPKNMDLVIQKATELGVREVVPVEASRSVLRLEGREGAKVERWQRIAREAAKQSRRTDIPLIHTPRAFPVFLESRDESEKLILSEDGGTFLRDILLDGPGSSATPGRSGVVLLVGPEGGWSKEEEQLAMEKGFAAVSLGKRILRSETAALAALATIQIFWGE
jgi:16S rRNA (uracil1498-N3)-methyltransferase